jgi:hypothetical protein
LTTWIERFGIASSALGAAWGAAVDLATSVFDDDDESFAEIAGNLGTLGVGTVNAFAQAGLGVGGGVLWGANYAAENLVSEPLSTVVTADQLAKSRTWGRNILDAETWGKARDMADTRSFGQAFTLAASGTDPLDDPEIERMKEGFVFNAVSGTIDAATAIFLDPTIVGGKAYAAGKAVSRGFGAGHRASDPWLQRQIAKRTKIGQGDIDPYEYANSQAVTDFLEWSAGKNGRQIMRL